MRAIFKPTIIERLQRLVDDADEMGREIEVIVVTDAEWREYRGWIVDHSFPAYNPHNFRTPFKGGTFFNGIRVLPEHLYERVRGTPQ